MRPPHDPSPPTEGPPDTRDVARPTGAEAGGGLPPLLGLAHRYELGEEIGRGGMGSVLRARDPRLNRDLAVKVLRGDDAGPDLLRRFVEEAQVCGQLQHPGIVPVHDLGTLPDGRPFFAMKLVRGRTLAELLRERAGPADGLPRLLGIFEQVCQAVAYAHSKGVLHRDLKPANVMVGAFGEVQVMDWGFAKVLRPGPRAAEENTVSTVRTVRSDSGEGSRDGQAMGTPAYMAPEQARGEVELLDERCDVFGLGAILCEILTGQPPFAGHSGEALARAMRGDLADAVARLDGCGADAELIGLAKACLAPEAGGRPRDGRAVAEAVTGYQHAVQERLRQAELGRARAEVRTAEERKRRRLSAALAAAALALVVVAAAGGLWAQKRHAEVARQEVALRRDVEVRVEQAARLRRAGRFPEALRLLEQGRELVGDGGPADLRGPLDQALADTALVQRLDDARQQAIAVAGPGIDIAGAEREYAAALRDAGLGREGEGAAVVAARVRASAVREEVVASLDDWASHAQDGPRREWLLAVARAADPDPLRDRLRDPALWRDRAALWRLAGEAQAAGLSPQLSVALGRALGGGEGGGVPLLQAAQALHPEDFWLNFELASALHQDDAAVGYYRAALALRPRAAAVHYRFGRHLYYRGRLEEAAGLFEQAVRLGPTFAWSHSGLGVVRYAQGRLEEATGHFEQALRLNPQEGMAQCFLGLTLKARGQLEEARDHLQQAVTLGAKGAGALSYLSGVSVMLGRGEEARLAWRKALDANPPEHDTWYGYAELCLFLGQPDEYRRARRDLLARFGATADPNVAERTGRACLLLPGTDVELRQAAALIDRALAAQPGKSGVDYPFFLFARGLAEYRRGRLDAAVATLGGLPARPLPDMQPAPGLVLAMAQHRQGHAEQARKTLAAAVLAYDWGRGSADRLAPWICHILRREAEALILPDLTALLAGVRQPRDNAERLAVLGACQFEGRHAAAARLYADAFAADPKLADDLASGQRYSAARRAALAAAGRGSDAPKPGGEERPLLRRQALGWLRADLALRAKQAESAKAEDRAAAAAALRYWQQDADLAVVRGKGALAVLPAGERAEWEKLWAEVADRLRRLDAGQAGK